jgi:hypothetical protein
MPARMACSLAAVFLLLSFTPSYSQSRLLTPVARIGPGWPIDRGGWMSFVAFSADGRLVAVGIYGTGAVWLADLRSGKILDQKQVSDLGCGSVAFSPDG